MKTYSTPTGLFRFAVVLAAMLLVRATATQAQIAYVSYNMNEIGEYNAATGATINANFITNSGLARGVVFSNNTLYFNEEANYTINAFNATTGAAVAGFTPIYNSTNTPNGVAAAGNNVYVSYYGMVTASSGTTGAPLAGFTTITGLYNAGAMAILGNNLFVANTYGDTVGEYNATTGAVINAAFLTLSYNLYVSSGPGDTIASYSLTNGAVDTRFTPPTGLKFPDFISVANNLLYISTLQGGTGANYAGSVQAYDATTGAPSPDFTTISNLYSPYGVAISTAPEPSTWALLLLGTALLLNMARMRHRFA